MATNEKTGTIGKTVLKKWCEETHIEWRIPDITTINENEDPDFHYESPSFFINDISCFLILCSNLDEEPMSMHITIDVEREFSPEYNISLKKLDGTVEHVVSGIPEKLEETFFDMGYIIGRSELLERMSELTASDVLTIVCRFKREVADSSETPGKKMPLKFIRLDKLSENFIHLFEEKESCDVTLKVKDKEYKAHRLVLIARSSVFAATFKHDTLERQMGVITISDCDPESFEVFLKYIYCGKLEEISCCSALNLYYTSDKYDVQELKTFCTDYLMQCLTVENVCEVAVFADRYDEATLFSTVQDFFNENARKIFVTPEWDNLLTTHRRLGNKLLIEMSNVKFKD